MTMGQAKFQGFLMGLVTAGLIVLLINGVHWA